MDKISFKGYDNILQRQYLQRESGNIVTLGVRILTTATNEGCDDLAQWTPILKSYPSSDEFIKIGLRSTHFVAKNNEYYATNDSAFSFFLNGKEVAVNDENLHVFTQIAKFFKYIKKSTVNLKDNSPTPFKYNERAKIGLAKANQGLVDDTYYLPPEEESFIQNPIEIRTCADFMNESLKEIMNKYLNTTQKNGLTNI